MTADPTFRESEDALLARAAAFPEFRFLSDLNAETLRKISTTHGVDFATALLYDRVNRSPQHAAFINRIDHAERLPPEVTSQNITVAVAPAAFYKEAPNSGADGKLILEEARRLELRAELIPSSSTGTLAENSAIIHHWLANREGEKIILVSLCKGGADVKFALGQPNNRETFRRVSSWINICGTLNGSPIAEWLLAFKPRFFMAWLACRCRGHDINFVRELQPAPQSALSQPLHLPAPMRLVNIVGFPLKRHLTNRFMRLCYQRISPFGPNDGGVLLADACSLPGLLYPIWGADHYLRPEPRARRIISTVLNFLATPDNREKPPSRTEIPAIDRTAQTSSV
ncbi:MAG TPA: hypothetical protein VGN61_06180 [Verrucomicrobiae bacterium]